VTAPEPPSVHVKHYRDTAARCAAERNYRWLSGLDGVFRVPRLLWSEGDRLGFERVTGRHAAPADLVPLAGHLGTLHAAAFATALRGARLDAPFRTAPGHLIPGFLEGRLTAVVRELARGEVPGAALTSSQAAALLRGACGEPAAIYKDANPRNFLITAAGTVMVDFDDLTLAPFGYDLAKLVVGLAMTHGALPATQIADALHAYHTATHRHLPGLAALTWGKLMAWAEIHHILTSRYLGRAGYRHSWHDIRPAAPAGPARKAIGPGDPL
jgi:Ser/Thr protein kinase RdoA (MazF antagonist)